MNENFELKNTNIINEIQIILGPEFVFDYELNLKENGLHIESLTEFYFKYRPLTSYKYAKLTQKILNFRLKEVMELCFVENAEYIKIGNYIHINIKKHSGYILK